MVCSTLTLPPQIPIHHRPKQQQQQPTPDLITNFNTPFELKQAHALLIKTHHNASLPLPRVALICALTPSFPYAHQILQRSHEQPLFIWNTCLKTLSQDTPQHALLLFIRLLQMGIYPDQFSFSFVLKACTLLLDVRNAKTIHGYVEKLGLLRRNLVLQNMVVHVYVVCGRMSDARLVFDKMILRDVVTWNIMLTGFIKAGHVGDAYRLFSSMPERNVRSWTTMISGFVQRGRPREAVDLFLEMEREGLRPNEVTVVAVLAACAELGDLEFGKRVYHRYAAADAEGFRRNVLLSNTLIDMYVKCGCLEEGYRVFHAIEERTVVSWSSMIAGFAMHGQGEKALELYDEMIRCGVEPNHVTFVGLLHACSHMGLVDKGREFFAIMTRDYGIVPTIEHYGCLVDLLSRAGLLEEAHEVIVNMPTSPNGVIWGTLLGGCRLHKNIVLAGCSSIAIDGQVHEFEAGDETHPQAEKIFERWEKLLVKMKGKGYVPNTSVVLLDVEDKEKEKFLFRHSEKLALVFGLINTKPGMTVRIMKNLRVCEDCHVAFKLLSAIENREIVVRDRNRFHCFKNGTCTCKDYW
ncbi:PREDICTED: pentatricopeptide repeat-containing protein At5g66520-like isoform X2 [Lupinus angustifolius]|uniref:pentatricopeptide repeat-containing protein At5g66520-like isoform X2 n=1 Tax=Lupinus angustifolius TaxID=3871 RepID=UPI00092E676F|nr:PREDICTED: pentatricopeptide repeat-containing protein At5g66520-like isoform X2 [Lupinus angustifolius]